jgi:hypothetical protein
VNKIFLPWNFDGSDTTSFIDTTPTIPAIQIMKIITLKKK